MLARQIQQPVREIVYRTRGLTHGPITRLMSPGDLGELLKPFVFLDLFVMDGKMALPPIEMGWHPHSGIATVSVIVEGAVRYAETTGQEGVLPAGGVEGRRPVQRPIDLDRRLHRRRNRLASRRRGGSLFRGARRCWWKARG